MSKKLFPIDLPRRHSFTTEVPENAVYRGIGLVRGAPFLFAEADIKAPFVEGAFRSVGSGEELPEIKGATLEYRGHYYSDHGKYRWHIYEEVKA